MARAYRITVPFASDDGKTINELLTMDDLLKISEPIIDRAIAPIDVALEKAGLKPQDIDMIILAGGSSQLPMVSKKIEQKLGKRPRKIPKRLMLAVAYGAALYHRDLLNLPRLRNESRILGEDLGLRVLDRGRQTVKLLMAHNTTLPKSDTFDFPLANGQTRATIHLVVMDNNTGAVRQHLKQRDLVLRKPAARIRVKLDINENRIIQVTAYNPDHPDEQSVIRVNQSDLSETSQKDYRNLLGIEISAVRENMVGQQCIGIDLGTTTSELAIADRSGDIAELDALNNPGIDSSLGMLAPYCFPSVVYFADGLRDVRVADTSALNARKDANADGKVFYTFKTKHVDREIAVIDNMKIGMQELSTYLLNKIWNTARNEYGDGLTSAVVTVPAAFTVDQCEATYNAAIMAGIPNITLIDEPTAAFYYYRHVQQINTDQVRNVLVFDFGGGTADVAILDISSGLSRQSVNYKDEIFSVRAISGDPNCGGRDVDKALCDEIIRRFEAKNGTHVSVRSMGKLRERVEEAKAILSESYAEDEDD